MGKELLRAVVGGNVAVHPDAHRRRSYKLKRAPLRLLRPMWGWFVIFRKSLPPVWCGCGRGGGW
ncbi:MAG: hypothetical protein KAR25_06865, partial [Methanosarcinales archaeon]|nr:hypothetical protein [Methanosarcinales archaeon]